LWIQVAALEEAILASLDVVGRLLRPPAPLDASAEHPSGGGGERYGASAPHAPCTLERMLLAGSADVGGGVSPAAALASYVTYKFSATIHRAAMHALSLLCTTAASLLPRPVPLTACLATAGGATTTDASCSTSCACACAALVELLDVAHARAQPAEFCAAAELLVVAVRCQPGLAELLLFPPATAARTTAGTVASGAAVRLRVLSDRATCYYPNLASSQG
jgi:hypothetical protein